MKIPEPDNPPKRTFSYIDSLIQIPAAVVIATMLVWPAEEYTVFGISSIWFFKPFLGMFLVSFMWLAIVNQITIELDKKIRWEEKFAKRSLFQLVFGWAVPVLVSFVVAKFYFGFMGIDVMKTLYSPHMYIGILGLPLIINCGYMFYYLFYFFCEGIYIAGQLTKGQAFPDELIFQQRGREVKFKTREIAYVFAHGKNTTIRTHHGSPVCLKLVSLKKVAGMLRPDHFCQVNKSYIISRSAYLKHRKHDRGLLLFLHPEASEPVIVGRYKVGVVLDFIQDHQTQMA